MLINKIINLMSIYREGGIKKVINHLARYCWRSRCYIFLEKIIDRLPDEILSEDYIFRNATQKDIKWLCKNMDHLGEKSEKIIREQFKDGDITVIGTSNDEGRSFVFSAWLSKYDYGLKLLGDLVNPLDFSVRRVWVPLNMRKRGIASLGMKYAEYAAFVSGSRKIWSFVEIENVASLLLHEKLGYVQAGRILLGKRVGRPIVKIDIGNTGVWRRFPAEKNISKL